MWHAGKGCDSKNIGQELADDGNDSKSPRAIAEKGC